MGAVPHVATDRRHIPFRKAAPQCATRGRSLTILVAVLLLSTGGGIRHSGVMYPKSPLGAPFHLEVALPPLGAQQDAMSLVAICHFGCGIKVVL